MAANSPKAIKLTVAETATDFLIEDNNIIRVFDDTLGATVVYSEKGARAKQIVVTQTADEIGNQATGLSDILIPITHTNGFTEYISYRRMMDVVTEGTGASIRYDIEGTYPATLKVTESIDDIQTLINALP